MVAPRKILFSKIYPEPFGSRTCVGLWKTSSTDRVISDGGLILSVGHRSEGGGILSWAENHDFVELLR